MRTGIIYKFISEQFCETYICSSSNKIRDIDLKSSNQYKNIKKHQNINCFICKIFENYHTKNCECIFIKDISLWNIIDK